MKKRAVALRCALRILFARVAGGGKYREISIVEVVRPLELADLTSEVAGARSSDAVARKLIDYFQRQGACVVHTFFGTFFDDLFVSTLPDWYLRQQYETGEILHNFIVQRVRSGVPRTLWGIDLDTLHPNCGSHPIAAFSHFRFEQFGQRSAMTFAFPSEDGTYQGAGIGIGFEDRGDDFLKRITENGGVWDVVAYAGFSRMLALRRGSPEKSPLSKRQAEILTLLASGSRLGEISDKLAISDSAVNLYLSNLKKKLGVRSREQALAMALTNGWIQP